MAGKTRLAPVVLDPQMPSSDGNLWSPSLDITGIEKTTCSLAAGLQPLDVGG